MKKALKLSTAALLGCLAAVSLAACGGSNVSSDAPKTVPDLTLPADANEVSTSSVDTTSGTTSDATDTTGTITGVPEEQTSVSGGTPDTSVDTTQATPPVETTQQQTQVQQTTPDTSDAGGTGIQ